MLTDTSRSQFAAEVSHMYPTGRRGVVGQHAYRPAVPLDASRQLFEQNASRMSVNAATA
jgi:hypothetical protein